MGHGDQRESGLISQCSEPKEYSAINERCLIRSQDDYSVVIVSGIVQSQYALTDHMAEAYAMVNLVEQGWADQIQVARAFGCSVRTVRRHQRRFENGGLAALGHGSGYPEGRRRLAGARTQLIQRLKADGHSNREIARRVGVSSRAQALHRQQRNVCNCRSAT
jgi:DNA-binding CsgD family transcriptional regulator